MYRSPGKKDYLPRGRFHPSGFSYVCARAYIFNHFAKLQVENDLKFAERLRMKSGTFLHEELQRYWLGPAGLLWGQWKHQDTEEVRDDCFCPDRTGKWEYVEAKRFDKEFKFSYRVDGFLFSDQIDLLESSKASKITDEEFDKIKSAYASKFPDALLEIKTTGDYVMKKLIDSRNLSEANKDQATIYMNRLGINKTVFLFMNRESFSTKVIIYEYEKERWDRIADKVTVILEGIEKQVLPTKYIPCFAKTDTRAQECPFADMCFDEQFNLKEFVQITNGNSIETD